MARELTPRPDYSEVRATPEAADERDCEAAQHLLENETAEHLESRQGVLFRLASVAVLAALALAASAICLTSWRGAPLSAGLRAAQGLAATEIYTSNFYLDVEHAAAFVQDPKATVGVEDGLARAAGVEPSAVTAELTKPWEEYDLVKVTFRVQVAAHFYSDVSNELDNIDAKHLVGFLIPALKSAMGHMPALTVARVVYGSFSIEMPDPEQISEDEKAIQEMAYSLADHLGVESAAVELRQNVTDKGLTITYLVQVKDALIAATKSALEDLTAKELTDIVAKGLHKALKTPPSVSVVDVSEVGVGLYYNPEEEGASEAQDLPATETYASNFYLDVEHAAAFAEDPKATKGIEDGLAKASGVEPSAVSAELTKPWEEYDLVKVTFTVEVVAPLYDQVSNELDNIDAQHLSGFLIPALKSAMGHMPALTVAQVVYGSFSIEMPDPEQISEDEKAIQEMAYSLADHLGVESAAVELRQNVTDNGLTINYLVQVKDALIAATKSALEHLTAKELTDIVAKGLHKALKTPPSVSVVDVSEVGVGLYYDAGQYSDVEAQGDAADDAEGTASSDSGSDGGEEEAK